MSNDDDTRARFSAIGKTAAEQTQSSMGAFAEHITAKSHPFVVADMVAARIHQLMFYAQEELTQSDPANPTALTHSPSVAVLRRGHRWVLMSHTLGDWRVFYGWGVGDIDPRAQPQCYTNGSELRNPSILVESMAHYLIGTANAVSNLEPLMPGSP